MNLEFKKWHQYQINDLFDVVYGVNLELNACIETTKKDPDSVNFVSRSKDNNGVTAYVKLIEGLKPQDAGIITVASGGSSVLSTFVQNEPFYSGRDLYLLIPKSKYKKNMSMEVKLYICTIIMKNKYRYSFGRQANKTLPYIELKLPTKNHEPDWNFMENYIKSLHHKPLTTKNHNYDVLPLIYDDWKEFILNDIFELRGGFYNKKPEHSIEGKIPFLASTESNNGVTEFYSLEDIKSWDKIGNEDNTLEKKLYQGNCIAVTVNGSVCNAFYQKEQFTCSHDITAFYIKQYEMSPSLAIFLCTIIMKDKYRWSYGRKPHDIKKFGKSIIKLPIKHNLDGTPFIDNTYTYSKKGYVPNWKFMEDYIKSLPYGDRI
ncbi:Restriction enzyme BgcI subunit beta [Megamonas hypermegale]|uniref:Restriction enzyme BgcI subunit beta n=1 Tax=Megamonas hypermegale TaxID=158847 RepID=A0A239TRP4_9FIRM|nr:restriction endonuclease subunit S [Megamonas hypermegale]SNV00480.1 Restriction enzyme BgcI subunit beta [Megamonas hypermegale]